MSIVAYVGLPRHGKSYSAVEQVILPSIQKGRTVVTNLALRKDAILRDFPHADIRDFPVAAVQADPPSIVDLCPPGAVVVVDEVWRLWPAGKKVDQIPEAFKSFLAEHGHRVDEAGNAQHVVLVTQDLAQIAAFARQLVEQTFVTVKLTVVGMSRKFRTDVFMGHPTGLNPPESQRVRQIFGRYRPQIYQYYVSHTMSEAAAGVGANEASVDDRANVFKRPLLMLAPVGIVGLVCFGLWGLRHGEVGSGVAGGGVAVAHAAGLAVGAPRGDLEVRAAPGVWWVSARLDGLCTPQGCGWAVVTDGERSEWVPLHECRQVGMSWECPGPSGWVSDAAAPLLSVDASAGPLRGRRTR